MKIEVHQSRYRSVFRLTALIISCYSLLTPLHYASAGDVHEHSRFTLPEGRVVALSIHDVKEYENLRGGSETFQIIRNGQLITFNSNLELTTTKPIINASPWMIDKAGSPIGVMDCTTIGFGLAECQTVKNLMTGEKIFTAPLGEHIDPHEILRDTDNNLWYLSYPKTPCKDLSELCVKYSVSKEKTFVDCQVNQVNTSGKLLYSWKASDHIPASMAIKSYTPEGGIAARNYLDFFHCNSIDLVGGKGFLISSRNTDSIFEVDIKSSQILWKLGGRYWPGVSLRASNFNRSVGKENIAGHDARYLGDGIYTYLDNASHSTMPARGVLFQVNQKKKSAKLIQEYLNPYGNNSLCTGSFGKVNEETFVVGWGCSLNAITLFGKTGLPVVTLNFLRTETTKHLYSEAPWILNGVNWGPATNLGLTYRVIHSNGMLP